MYYYNENGAKVGPIRGSEFKQCVRQGIITSETRVEDRNGNTGFARNVPGFPFNETELRSSGTSTVILPPITAANPFVTPLSRVRQRILENVPPPPPIWEKMLSAMASLIKSLVDIVGSIVALILVLLLCGVVVIVLLNVFYVTQPGFVPPKWLEPVMFLNPHRPDSDKKDDEVVDVPIVASDISTVADESPLIASSEPLPNQTTQEDFRVPATPVETPDEKAEREREEENKSQIADEERRMKLREMLARAVNLEAEIRRNGFDNRGITGNFDFDRGLQAFVQYGSATLEYNLNEAQANRRRVNQFDDAGRERADAAINGIQAIIRRAQEEIAGKVFIGQYTCSSDGGNNLGGGNSRVTMSFSMPITPSTLPNVEDILLPHPDVTLTSISCGRTGNVDLSISGSTPRIGELVSDSRNYRARVGFTNLRSTGGQYSTPSAEVLRIEFFRVGTPPVQRQSQVSQPGTPGFVPRQDAWRPGQQTTPP